MQLTQPRIPVHSADPNIKTCPPSSLHKGTAQNNRTSPFLSVAVIITNYLEATRFCLSDCVFISSKIPLCASQIVSLISFENPTTNCQSSLQTFSVPSKVRQTNCRSTTDRFRFFISLAMKCRCRPTDWCRRFLHNPEIPKLGLFVSNKVPPRTTELQTGFVFFQIPPAEAQNVSCLPP